MIIKYWHMVIINSHISFIYTRKKANCMDNVLCVEQRKSIPGYNSYEASNIGRIRNKNTGHILRPNRNKKGYRHVVLYKGSKANKHMIGVHRVVALAWIFTNDITLTVNHKDNNPNNNSVENLEWMKNEDNIRYTQGEKIICNETGIKYDSLSEASRKTGISISTIKRNLRNEYKRTQRSIYTWSYLKGGNI